MKFSIQKNILLIGFILLNQNLVSAQVKLGVIDLDSFSNKIYLEYGIEQKIFKNKKLLIDIAQIWIEELQKKAIKDIGCFLTPELIKKKEEELINTESEIIKFQNYVSDTIDNYKYYFIKKVKSILSSDYIKIGKREGYKYVIDKSQIIYEDSKFNTNNYMIRRKLNLSSRIRNLNTELDEKVFQKSKEIMAKIDVLKDY